MVLIERYIPAIQNLENEPGNFPYKFNPSPNIKVEMILEQEVHNSMIGILTQLSWLASYAGDLFKNILENSTKTFNRINTLTSKFQSIKELVPTIEKTFETTPLDIFTSNKRSEFTSNTLADACLFTNDSLPKPLFTIYKEKCSPPPALSKMDPYMDDGKKCLELYTNPRFFLDTWIEEQMKQRQQAKEERRKRREAKKTTKRKST
jgi:hypothetical protein